MSTSRPVVLAELKLDYATANRDLAVGDIACPCTVSVDGLAWKIYCYPHGRSQAYSGYLNLFLGQISKPRRAYKVAFNVFLAGADGEKGSVNDFPHALRLGLAFGSASIADAAIGCMITLGDIEPATFRALLRFMYTDELHADKQEELRSASSSTKTAAEFFQDLLEACVRPEAVETVSVETVVAMLGFSEMNSCPELKNKCIDFLTTGKNFQKVALTDDYFELRNRFPSVIDDIRNRLV